MSAPARQLPIAPTTPLAKPAKWDHRKYGTLADPVHKSHQSTLLGEFSCGSQFRFDRNAELEVAVKGHCAGATEMGTAVHETIARALRKDVLRDALLAGQKALSKENAKHVLLEEFARATAGKEVVWYGKSEYEKAVEDATEMVFGALTELHKHVAKVLLVEAGWIAKVADFYTEGHVDLVYEPRNLPGGIGYTDWKSGATKPAQVVLDHGYESGFYANAIATGLFLPVEVLQRWRALAASEPARVPLAMWDAIALEKAASDRHAMHVALRGLARMREEGHAMPEGVILFGRFPDEIRLTQLRDYIPYDKNDKKEVKRPEDVTYWRSVEGATPCRMVRGEGKSRSNATEITWDEFRPGDLVKYAPGMMKGPAWIPINRTADDLPRLETMLRSVVGQVRMGKFSAAVDEKCNRCTYKATCLTGGYELRGDEAKALQSAFKGIETPDLDFSDND